MTHAYDLAGNHWYTGTVNNETIDWYGFDGTLGGIDPFDPNAAAPFNGSDQIAPWSYDPFGNLTGPPSRSYTFDAEERLTKVTDGGGSTLLTAGYQGDGQRAWKTVTAADGTLKTTYFVYDGDDPVVEQESDGNGGARVTAVNLFGAEGLLSRRMRQLDGTYATTSYQFDPSGSVAARLNGAGQVTGCDLYAAYGARTARQGTVDPNDPWGYEAQFGYYEDRETGLLLLGSRYYDPQAGRFVTRDPIGAEGGANLYAYADGDPINNVDPDGTRDLTAKEHQLVDKLEISFEGMATPGSINDNELARTNVFRTAFSQFEGYIHNIKPGSPDPPGLSALEWSIGQLGDTKWGSAPGSAGVPAEFGIVRFPPTAEKCNLFIVQGFRDPNGGNRADFPSRGSQPYAAGDYFGGSVPGLTSIPRGQQVPGDIISVGPTKGYPYSHVMFHFGGDLAVAASSANGRAVVTSERFQSTRKNRKGMYVVRRFR